MKQIYLESYFQRGYRSLMKYISNIAHLSSKDREVIKKRINIIEFFDEFGAKACKQAFSKSRSTIYLWKQKLKQEYGRLSSLCPGSRIPHTKRQRETDQRIISYIENYRIEHPGVCKETIKYELDQYCLNHQLKAISSSTIGRIIRDLKQQAKLPQSNKLSYYARTGRLIERKKIQKDKKLRRGGYQPEIPGDLVQIDAIEIFHNGLKRYFITAIDLPCRFGFAYLYKTLSSASAKDFLIKLQSVAPFAIRRIQTDNGKEFHQYFREYANSQKIIHFYNYPRSPQMNNFVEAFNGIIQRQYIDWHHDELENTEIFNRHLMKYLLWYNTRKQHQEIGRAHV